MSQFLWVTFKVINMEKSVQFYKDVVGLEIQRQFTASPTMEIVFLGDQDGTKVELIFDRDNEVQLGYPEHLSLGFAVDNIEEKIKEVSQKGVAVHSGPFRPGVNTEFFYVVDPNGLKIQFVKEG